MKSLPEISSDQKNRIKALYDGVVKTLHTVPGPLSPLIGGTRSRRSSSQFLRPQITGVNPVTSITSDKTPLFVSQAQGWNNLGIQQ